MTAISAGLAGFLVKRLNWLERILLVGAGLCLVDPGVLTDIIGIIVLGGIAMFQFLGSPPEQAVDLGQVSFKGKRLRAKEIPDEGFRCIKIPLMVY